MDPYEVGGPLPHTSCDHFTHAPRRCEKFIVHTLRVSGKGKAGAQAGLTFCLEKAEREALWWSWGVAGVQFPRPSLWLACSEFAAGVKGGSTGLSYQLAQPWGREQGRGGL